MKKTTNHENKHNRNGHRKRLRERFLQGGIESLLDYEIVELLLTLGTPRRDCKVMAKEAIKFFGGLEGVLSAPPDELQQIKGVGVGNIFGIRLFDGISKRRSRKLLPKKMDFKSIPQIAEYIKKNIGQEQKEHFMAYYLDGGNQIVGEKVISIGSLNSSVVHPREVFESAILKRAAAIILAHNHPSGKISPSTEDRGITKQLVETGRLVGIEVFDHIIVTSSEYFSFKQELIL